MKNEVRCASLHEFMSELKKRNIDTIVSAEVNEKRAVQKEENLVEVVRFRKVELLAYKDAVMYKCIFTGTDLEKTGADDIYRELSENDFKVTRKNRNIT